MGRDRAYEGTQCLDKVWLERDMKVGGHDFRITGRWQNVPLGLLGGCVYHSFKERGDLSVHGRSKPALTAASSVFFSQFRHLCFFSSSKSRFGRPFSRARLEQGSSVILLIFLVPIHLDQFIVYNWVPNNLLYGRRSTSYGVT